MDSLTNLVGRTETWLMTQNGMLRRPLSKDHITTAEFRSQRKPHVHYVVFRRQSGTYSDGKGGLPRWKRAKISMSK